MRRDKQEKDTSPCKPRKLSTGFYYFKQRSDNVVPFFRWDQISDKRIWFLLERYV